MVLPGIRPDETPRLHTLGEYPFQDLCRDVLDHEPTVSTCDIYGARGQRQHGVDLLAHRRNDDGIELGQCKCYEQFPASAIKKASDEFFDHWGHWAEKKVKRFILFVACDVSRTEQQDQIIEEKHRFAAVGIAYEAWSSATIRTKLRPYPELVGNYFDPADYWIQRICGRSPAPYKSADLGQAELSPLLSSAVLAQNEELAAMVAGGTEQDLERMRSARREGRAAEARDWVNGLKSKTSVWLALPAGVRAAVLRFEAGLEVDLSGDIARAKALADEARALVPEHNDTALRAWIEYRQSGAERALDLLGGDETTDGLNLKGLLLLQLNRAEEAERVLSLAVSKNPSDAEALRLRSLVAFVRGDLAQARLEIQKALERKPQWKAIRLTGAIVDYFSALSPAASPGQLVSWPEPVSWALVKRDEESLARLRQAEAAFAKLLEEAVPGTEERRSLQAWRLACLANDPERQQDAIAYCRELLQADPTHYRAVAWAAARNFEIDLTPFQSAIQASIEAGSAGIPEVIALTSSWLAAGASDDALRVLDQLRPLFGQNQQEVLWTLLRSQALVIGGDPQGALAAIDESGLAKELRRARTFALAAIAREEGDPSQLAAHLEVGGTEAEDATSLFEGCQLMAQQGNWPYVAGRAERLVNEIGTADALGLAATAAYHVKRYRLSLELLDSHRHLFPNGKLPSELRQLRIVCQHELGILPQALAEAEALAQEDPSIQNQLNLAHLYFAKGDLKAVAIVARRVLVHPNATHEQLLSVAELALLEDPQVARSLWRRAVREELPEDAVGPAVGLGFQLGLDSELRPLLGNRSPIMASFESRL